MGAKTGGFGCRFKPPFPQPVTPTGMALRKPRPPPPRGRLGAGARKPKSTWTDKIPKIGSPFQESLPQENHGILAVLHHALP